jgi:VWFA-related protein
MKTVRTAPRLAFAAAALVLAMAAVRAQNAEPQGEAGVRFKSGVELVNVTATVSDSLGRFVPGLQRDDFLVYEDNNPVEIMEFSAERVPVSLGIALDTSGSMAGSKMEAARAALTRFTEELLDRADELFLYRFSNYPGLAQGWTNDRQRILYALDRMTPNGGTAMYDAVEGRDSPGAAGPEPQAGARCDLGRQRYGQPRGHPRPQAADSRERGPGVRRRDRRRRRGHCAPWACSAPASHPDADPVSIPGNAPRPQLASAPADRRIRAAISGTAGSTTASTPPRCAR